MDGNGSFIGRYKSAYHSHEAWNTVLLLFMGHLIQVSNVCVWHCCSTWTCWRTAVEWGKDPFWSCSVTSVSISLKTSASVLKRAIGQAGRAFPFLWARGNDRGDRCDDIIASNAISWVTMVTAHRLTSCTNAHINSINRMEYKQVRDRIHTCHWCL